MAFPGVNFIPTGDQSDQQGGQARSDQLGGAPPLQQAIRFLSLRLPKFTGPGGIAPPALMNGAGAAGLPGGPESLAELLRTLGGMQPQGAPPITTGAPVNYPGGSPNRMPREQMPAPGTQSGSFPPMMAPAPPPTPRIGAGQQPSPDAPVMGNPFPLDPGPMPGPTPQARPQTYNTMQDFLSAIRGGR